jgi:clan AA aspartic protease (TIGR02281 family)
LNRTNIFRLIVDTGAQQTVISRDVSDTLGLDIARPLRFDRIVTAERQIPPTPVVRIDSVQVAGMIVRNLEASVIDLPSTLKADGLLGLNFLRRFRVTFEFDRSTLILRRL